MNINRGFFHNPSPGTDVCLECPLGGKCKNANTSVSIIETLQGFWHSLHITLESEPTAVENLPAVQLIQVKIEVAPMVELYFPASHISQPVETLQETVK